MQTNNRTDRQPPGQAGFTLVEMLIAIGVTLIVMAGVSTVFIAHSRQYSQQDDMAALRQNLRGTLQIMPNEFRLAGCDPLKSGDPGIEEATSTLFDFTADIGGKPSHNNDADGKIGDCALCSNDKGCCAGERVAYWFRRHHRTCGEEDPETPQGDPDYPAGVLCRKALDKKGEAMNKRREWVNAKADINPLADNIENLEFSYVLENDRIICPNEKNPDGRLSRAQLSKVRAVQITILARAEYPSTGDGHRHAGLFKTACGREWKSSDPNSPDYVPQDGHRRKLLITTVQLRNMPMPHKSKNDNDFDE